MWSSLFKEIPLIFVLFWSVIAVDPAYYDPAQDALEREEYYRHVVFEYDHLHFLLNKTHSHHLSYDVARHKYLYPVVDRYPDQLLRGVYTNISFEAIPKPVLYNCEHIVPQSWFHERSPMKADLHHLFTAEGTCNSFRSNHPFAVGVLRKERVGCGKLIEQTPIGFEPNFNHGAVARATLYFLVRYPGFITSNLMPLSSLTLLIDWAQDSPSLWELHRNQQIAKAQGNRNPFVDFPFLATQIELSKGYANHF